MKVICPKCQFENQADSTRIVCARCATIIEVRADQNAGFEPNGKRQTARLPFSPNPGNSQPLGSQSFNQKSDNYATRIGDDFDDVLDIPRPAQAGFPTNADSPQAFDDVFAMPNYDSSASYDFSGQERKSAPSIETFNTGNTGASRQRETQDYAAAPEPEFMGWPVLPENNDDDDEQGGGFSMSRGSLLLRVVLGVAVFGLLCFLAYYFLADQLSKRKDQSETVVNTTQPSQAQNPPPATLPPVNINNIEPSKPQATDSQKSSSATTTNPPPATSKSSEPTKAAANGNKTVSVPPITSEKVGPIGRTASPKPAPQANPPAVTPNKGNLTIQIGSFSDQSQANDRVAKLKAAGVEGRIVKAELPGKGTWYRVQVGGFKTREEAVSYGNQLKSKGVPEFIVTTIGK